MDALDKSLQQQAHHIREMVLDQGYHSNATMTFLQREGIRSYVPEPDRGRRRWKNKLEAQLATYSNRRRITGKRGKSQQRCRGGLVELTFADCLGTGALRRVDLRHRDNVLKRVLIRVGAFNLSLIMRKTVGKGPPRGLADLSARLLRLLLTLPSSLASATVQLHSPRDSLLGASATG